MIDLDKVSLAIAMPHSNICYPKKFVDSFMTVQFPLHAHYIIAGSSGPLDSIRNELVRQAQLAKCTHIFMVDTDQIYPQDIFMKLISHDRDIVAGKVHRRMPPYDPILLRGSIDKFEVVPDEEWTSDKLPSGLVKVDATGFGCVLIKMEVFEAIDPPWFEFKLYDAKTPIGEDVYFYGKARKAGFEVFVDCSVKIGHIHSFIINEETYFTFKYNTAWDRKNGDNFRQGS